MTKRNFVFVCVLLVALLLCGSACAAATPPVTATMELNPAFLASPGEITVTISISNVTDQDLTKPVTLYDSLLQPVSDFGTGGELMLKAGETYTWTGTCQVDQNMLDHGLITYSCKYFKVGEDGQEYEQTAPIQGKLLKEAVATLLQVQRTITPQVAKPETKGTVTYVVTNAGTVSLKDIAIKEHDDIDKDTHNVPELPPGKTFKIEFPFVMGEKNLTSGATITYYSEESSEKQAYVVEDQQILCGNSSISATLSSNSKGAVSGSVVTLTLKLKNEGTIDFSDIRVTDPVLGDVFTNQQLAAGQELELTKEITLTETANYQFSVTAVDASGNESVTGTETVTVTAVKPEDALNLSVAATADKTEAYGNPADVRFTLVISNDSNVPATNVKIMHGEVELATYETIAAGESRTLNRDTALTYSGKYQFTVQAQDPLENELTFSSNELQIAVYAPTPPPATPTPFVETPTPEPFVPATYIPANHPSVGTVPKAIRSWVFPGMIISAVLCVACLGLLVVATKRRADRKKASDEAYDHLERARRRDYITPSIEERERAQQEQLAANPRKRKELTPEQQEAQMANRRIVGQPRDEEPGWNFSSDEFGAGEPDDLTDETSFSSMKSSLFDEDLTVDLSSGYDHSSSDSYSYADAYADEYSTADTYADESDGYTDQLESSGDYALPRTEYLSDEAGQAYTDSGYSDTSYADDYADPVDDAQDSQWSQYSEDSYYDDYAQTDDSAYYPSEDGYSDVYEDEQPLQSAYYDPAQGDYSYTEDNSAEQGMRRRSRFRNDN